MTTATALADGFDRQLDPRSLDHQRIVNWIVVATVGIPAIVSAAIAIGTAGLPSWAAAPLVAVVIGGVGALGPLLNRWAAVTYRHTSYRIDTDGLEIRRGVFWRRVVNVPRTRVQHTDVSQGPLERAYGLGTLVVFTAGTDHARVSLAGLDHRVALHLRHQLLPRQPAQLSEGVGTDDATGTAGLQDDAV